MEYPNRKKIEEVSKKTEERKLADQEEVIPQNIALPEEEDINMAAEVEEAVVVAAGDFPFSKLLSSLPKYDGSSPWNIHESALE